MPEIVQIIIKSSLIYIISSNTYLDILYCIIYNSDIKYIPIIANQIRVSTGSLSNNLNNLQNQDLIKFENEKYQISEPIITHWLQLEFKNKGNFQYRF